MEKIKSSCIISSSAFAVKKSAIRQYEPSNKSAPVVGDLVFGEVSELGHHRLIESESGRLHTLNVGTRVIFVFGNRYAPDQYEGIVPDSLQEFVELFSQGGVIGEVKTQIVFHGDTMNTTARILGKCNELKAGLLASDQLIRMIGLPRIYSKRSVGEIELRGKQEPIKLFEVIDYVEDGE